MRDYAANLFLLGFALLIMYEAHSLGLGTLRVPGVGFTAFWAAFVLAALSAVHFLVIYFRSVQGSGTPLFEATLFTQVIPAFVVLSACSWLLPRVGFVAVICLLMMALVTIVKQRLVFSALPVSIMTAIACHLLFQTLLGGQFPRGAFGF